MAEHTAPDRIYADLNMGIWLSKPQQDRKPCPPTEYISAPVVADLVKALEEISHQAGASTETDAEEWLASIGRLARSALSRFRELEKGNGNALSNTGSAT